MNFYDDFILSEKIDKTHQEMIDLIRTGKNLFHTYLIALPLYVTENQLELFHIEIHKQPLFQMEEYLVVGVALGYQDALEMVKDITEIVYKETGDADIKQYYLGKI